MELRSSCILDGRAELIRGLLKQMNRLGNAAADGFVVCGQPLGNVPAIAKLVDLRKSCFGFAIKVQPLLLSLGRLQKAPRCSTSGFKQNAKVGQVAATDCSSAEVGKGVGQT